MNTQHARVTMAIQNQLLRSAQTKGIKVELV